jgi:hypothetical protein
VKSKYTKYSNVGIESTQKYTYIETPSTFKTHPPVPFSLIPHPTLLPLITSGEHETTLKKNWHEKQPRVGQGGR